MAGLTIVDSMLCAGGEGKAACKVTFFIISTNLNPKQNPTLSHQGDSGGPLTVNGVLVGIVSHGRPGECNQNNTYDVFTSVSQHISWLNQTILQHGGMSACDYILTIDSTITPGRSPVLSHMSQTNLTLCRLGHLAGRRAKWVIQFGLHGAVRPGDHPPSHA